MSLYRYQHEKQINNQILFEVTEEYSGHLMHKSIDALTFRDRNNRLVNGAATLISSDIFLTLAHNIYNKK